MKKYNNSLLKTNMVLSCYHGWFIDVYCYCWPCIVLKSTKVSSCDCAKWAFHAVAGDGKYPNNMVPSITEVTDTGPVITTTILYIYFMLYCAQNKNIQHTCTQEIQHLSKDHGLEGCLQLWCRCTCESLDPYILQLLTSNHTRVWCVLGVLKSRKHLFDIYESTGQ